MEWIMSPPWCVQVLIAGAYECDLFGNRVFSLAMRLVKMRYWIGVSPKSRHWCPYGERRGHIQGRHLHEDTKEHGSDVETSQGMARIASRLQKPGRDKEGKEGFSPGTFRWIIALLILESELYFRIQNLYFPELGENTFCCFRSPSLWQFVTVALRTYFPFYFLLPHLLFYFRRSFLLSLFPMFVLLCKVLTGSSLW